MDVQELKYWVGFNRITGIGRVRFSQLENYFGNLENAWKAGYDDLKKAGLDNIAVQAIVTERPQISPDAEMEKLDRFGVKVFTYHDDRYPSRLKEIYDYPPVLYIRGSIESRDEYCVGVVGTRRATVYGRQVTEEIVSELVRNGITVASGLARGIDAVAHRAALAEGGRTLAVFACGLDTVYPAEHAELARNIMSSGALISEYPLGARPRSENFPRRNRILSGLSLGVLVVEAGETSGAIITANMALEQDREVFAVPGSILSPSSVGTNKLIQEGAKLVTCCNDILEELNLKSVTHQIEMKEVIPPSETEATLLKHLSREPVHVDEVCRRAGLSISVVSSTLAMMELKGMVRHVGNMNYVLARESQETYRTYLE